MWSGVSHGSRGHERSLVLIVIKSAFSVSADPLKIPASPLDAWKQTPAKAIMPYLHQWDYLFAFGTIFATLDAYNIGANDVANVSTPSPPTAVQS